MLMLTTILRDRPDFGPGVLLVVNAAQYTGLERARTQISGGGTILVTTLSPGTGWCPPGPITDNFPLLRNLGTERFCGVLLLVLYFSRLCSVCSVAPAYIPPTRVPHAHTRTR